MKSRFRLEHKIRYWWYTVGFADSEMGLVDNGLLLSNAAYTDGYNDYKRGYKMAAVQEFYEAREQLPREGEPLF